MARKNQMGFRNDLIKEYTPEQVQELVRQKSVLDNMDAEAVYARIMLLLTQFLLYAQQFEEFTEASWLQFVEELARVREKLNDGFYCYSMVEKIGTAEAKKLFSLIGNKAIFGVLAYNIAKYILDGGPQQEFTLKVMKNLTFLEAWKVNDLNENEMSYAVRNFFGKAVEVFKNREFVKWLMHKFDISDYTDFKGKDFVSAYANFYISIEEMSRENPEKVAMLVRMVEQTKVDSSTAEKESVQAVSIPEQTSTIQIESTPNLTAPKLKIEELLKNLRASMYDKQNAELEVAKAEEKYALAQGDVRKLELQLEKLSRALKDAKLEATDMQIKLQEAQKRAEQTAGRYLECKKMFGEEYRRMFDE